MDFSSPRTLSAVSWEDTCRIHHLGDGPINHRHSMQNTFNIFLLLSVLQNLLTRWFLSVSGRYGCIPPSSGQIAGRPKCYAIDNGITAIFIQSEVCGDFVGTQRSYLIELREACT